MQPPEQNNYFRAGATFLCTHREVQTVIHPLHACPPLAFAQTCRVQPAVTDARDRHSDFVINFINNLKRQNLRFFYFRSNRLPSSGFFNSHDAPANSKTHETTAAATRTSDDACPRQP